MLKELTSKETDFEGFVEPAELYKWIMDNFHQLSLDEQEIMLEIFNIISWIPEFLDSLTQGNLELIPTIEIKRLNDETTTYSTLVASCFIYNLEQRGINVSSLRDAINSSKRVKKQISKLVAGDFYALF